MKRDPKYVINNIVHVHGTPGTGKIVFVEELVNKYIYHIEYVIESGIRKIKQAREEDLIFIDSGSVSL